LVSGLFDVCAAGLAAGWNSRASGVVNSAGAYTDWAFFNNNQELDAYIVYGPSGLANKLRFMYYKGADSTFSQFGADVTGNGSTLGKAYITYVQSSQKLYLYYNDNYKTPMSTVMKYDTGSAAFKDVGTDLYDVGTISSVSLSANSSSSTDQLILAESSSSTTGGAMYYNGTSWRRLVARSGSSYSLSVKNTYGAKTMFDSVTGAMYIGYVENNPSGSSYVYMQVLNSSTMAFDFLGFGGDGTAGCPASTLATLDFNIGGYYDSVAHRFVPYIVQAAPTAFNVYRLNAANVWETVGNTQFASGNALSNIAFDDDNLPFFAYRDSSVSNKISVMKLNASNVWNLVGSAGALGSCQPALRVALGPRNTIVVGALPVSPALISTIFWYGCPMGYYYDAANANGPCVACSAGTYSVSIGATSSANCQKCPLNTYGPTSAANSSSYCYACPIGTCALTTGSTVCGSCDGANVTCAAGSYNNGTNCVSCKAGTYSSEAGAKGACPSCPAGTYGTDVGATSNSSCLACPVGYYSDVTGATSCKSCPEGTYRDTTGGTSLASCTKCEIGTFSTRVAANSSSLCQNCPAGQYGLIAGATACTDCTVGTFNPLTKQSSCQQCPAGYRGTSAAATSNSTCVICAAGTFSLAGASSCQSCGPGTYSTSPGATSDAACTKCAKGTYSAASGASSASTCTPCVAGRYGTVMGATAASSCLQCPAGQFSPTSGSTNCTLCPPGKAIGVTGSSSCTPCSAGSYTDSEGSSACLLCPAGYFNPNTSSTSISSCLPCAIGQFSGGSGASACDPCSRAKTVAATTCPRGDAQAICQSAVLMALLSVMIFLFVGQ
jgi:hypothetical protein